MTKQNLPHQKVIMVTGSSNGIGRLTVETLARQGHTVYASMRNANGRNAAARTELQQLAKDDNLDLSVIELDVTDDTSVEKAVADIIENTGRVDVLVNNAGVMNIGITEGFTLEQVQRQFDVNFYGTVRTNRAVLPHMRKQGEGLLIQISSLAGRVVLPFFGIYNASKFAVEAMSEAYRYELSGSGIDSVIVEPGPYGTNLFETIPWPDDKRRLKQYADLAAAPGSMIANFEELNKSDDGRNPQEVADAISELIVTPTGQRPLRTVVGIDYGVKGLNETAAPFQRGLLEALGMQQMEQLVSTTKAA
ncbi:MAG: SDR family oxidoreductase [Verrucomicrobia bacterium]|nr:SDR family oxidoreductase [Verrucomicrobiota bacterium]